MRPQILNIGIPVVVAMFLSGGWACNIPAEFTGYRTDRFPFLMEEPVRITDLGNEVEELSGLCLAWGRLVAVDDEENDLFFLDIEKGKVVEKHKVKGLSDAEAVTFLRDRVWIVESDGGVYHVAREGKKQSEDVLLESFKGEIEGACFVSPDSLWLAIKRTGRHKYGVIQSSLVIVNPESKAVIPVELDREMERVSNGLIRHVHPSGLVYDASRLSVFVLCHREKLLIQWKNGEVCSVVPLLPKQLPQPEGITLDRDGNLILGSEKGKGLPARLLLYQARPVDE